MSTKKDFQAAADTVRLIENKAARKARAFILAEEFARQNPRFKRSLFLAACNVSES